MSTSAPPAATSRNVAIVDLLDRLLTAGAVVQGDVVLSAADIDLVRLDLRLLLASVDTITPSGEGSGADRDRERSGRRRASPAGGPPARPPAVGSAQPPAHVPAPRPAGTPARSPAQPPAAARSAAPPARRHPDDLAHRISADPEGAEKGLAQLVLTIVELLRQLMERQAIHRVDAGSLDEEEVERLGATFQALAERMEELKTVFGLDDEDLNLNLGPLGDLL